MTNDPGTGTVDTAYILRFIEDQVVLPGEYVPSKHIITLNRKRRMDEMMDQQTMVKRLKKIN